MESIPQLAVIEPAALAPIASKAEVGPAAPSSVVTVHTTRYSLLHHLFGCATRPFGRTGRMAGEFKGIHNMAIDAQGNLYTAEVGYGRRLQRFVRDR